MQAALAHGSQHDAPCSVEIFLVFQSIGRSLFAIGLACDVPTQLFRQVIERVGHVFHAHGLIIPGLHLGGVGCQLLGKILIDGFVFLRGVGRGAVQTVAHDVEAFQHFVRHVERQHGQEDDVHQVDHLLAWRNRTFFYCHCYSLFFGGKFLEEDVGKHPWQGLYHRLT